MAAYVGYAQQAVIAHPARWPLERWLNPSKSRDIKRLTCRDSKYPTVGNPLSKWRLQRVFDYVDTNIGAALSLSDLATAAMCSRMHFARQFRRATGLRPHSYVLSRRVEIAQSLMLSETLLLKSIAMRLGFRTQAHFANVFRNYVGVSPRQWRSQHSCKPDVRLITPVRGMSNRDQRQTRLTAERWTFVNRKS